ncbi:MAG: TonB-dependent receptor [Rhizomicrobium sp.]
MKTRNLKSLMLGASALTLAAPLLSIAAQAQSTGTQEVETVVVTSERTQTNGLMNAAPIAKERSTITSEFLQTQTAGQTVFQSLNYMPGVNFTNNDPYGSSGGNIRMHGQDGNHISLTLDGMPLNDTGNYAVYTNQQLDPEVVDRISANQGSTDVDSPTAAATGGVIAIISDHPHENFGAEAVLTGGSFSDQRYFGRIDSGTFGPWDTKAFASLSWQDYDKFKGPGDLKKWQGNVKFEQDFGDLGWITLAGHWNSNRNNSYYAEDYVPNTTGFTGSTTVPPSGLAATADLIKGPDGGYIANPLNTSTSFSGTGWDRDYMTSCAYTAPVAGTADNTMTTCGNFYKVKINPSDTGNIRMQSLWHLADALTLTADANVQYVLANGGGAFSFKENGGQLIGNTTIAGAGTTTTPYTCLAGRGCDLNGDGDVMDTVELYQPSTTNTRRWGFNMSLIYEFDDNNTVQAAYTLDYGLHRQTGTTSYFDPVNGPYDPFAGLKDKAHEVLDADGTPLRYRDRKSKAIMNQAAFDYEGKYFDGAVRASLGFRLPFLERDLNQYCYEQAGSSTAYCTNQTPTSFDAASNRYFFAGGNAAGYTAPGHTVRRYNRFLPHLGLSYLPFGDEHQFFASYTQEIAAPRTDNLYQSVCTSNSNPCTHYTTFTSTKPETSTTYQAGYRYLTSDLQASLVYWNSQVRNRIVSSFDPDTNTYFDHNVSGVNFWGFDMEANWFATDQLSFYANGGYDRARITGNIPVGGGSVPTLNKQLSETPKWTFSGRAQFAAMPDLRLGLEGKYVGKRNQTEDNNAFVPDYFTVNADITYDLDAIGWDNSSIRFNVDNVLNKHYFTSLGTQTCWTPVAPTTSGCTTFPYAYLGSPRIFQVSLTARY